MNEQLKQELDKCFKRSAVIYWIEFELSADAILNDPSILRHADPEIMRQAGWVKEEDLMNELMQMTFDKMKTKTDSQEIESIINKLNNKP